MEDDGYCAEGRDAHPGENDPKNDNQHIHSQDKTEDSCHCPEKIREKNHFGLIPSVKSWMLLIKNALVLGKKVFELLSGDDIAA